MLHSLDKLVVKDYACIYMFLFSTLFLPTAKFNESMHKLCIAPLEVKLVGGPLKSLFFH